MKNIYEKILNAVKRIPFGKVASYGQIAAMVKGSTPRMVGYALASLKEDSVPWWRIVNSQLKISPRTSGGHHILQRKLLESEGVRFSSLDKIEKSFRYK